MLLSPGFVLCFCRYFLRKSSTTPVTSVTVYGLVTLTSFYTSLLCCRHTWTHLYPRCLLWGYNRFTVSKTWACHLPYVPSLPPALLSKLNHHHVLFLPEAEVSSFLLLFLYPPRLSASLLPGPVNSNPYVSFESTHFSPFHYLVQASRPWLFSLVSTLFSHHYAANGLSHCNHTFIPLYHWDREELFKIAKIQNTSMFLSQLSSDLSHVIHVIYLISPWRELSSLVSKTSVSVGSLPPSLAAPAPPSLLVLPHFPYLLI